MVNKVKGEMMMKEAPEDPNATQVKGTAGCLDQSNINMAESIRMVVAVIAGNVASVLSLYAATMVSCIPYMCLLFTNKHDFTARAQQTVIHLENRTITQSQRWGLMGREQLEILRRAAGLWYTVRRYLITSLHLLLRAVVVLDQGLEDDILVEIQKYLQDIVNSGLRQRLISLLIKAHTVLEMNYTEQQLTAAVVSDEIVGSYATCGRRVGIIFLTCGRRVGILFLCMLFFIGGAYADQSNIPPSRQNPFINLNSSPPPPFPPPPPPPFSPNSEPRNSSFFIGMLVWLSILSLFVFGITIWLLAKCYLKNKQKLKKKREFPPRLIRSAAQGSPPRLIRSLSV